MKRNDGRLDRLDFVYDIIGGMISLEEGDDSEEAVEEWRMSRDKEKC